MPPARPVWDYSGIIPAEFSNQIIEEAIGQSVVLGLGNRLPMGTGVSEIPIPKTLPSAAFVTAPGGRKPYTPLALEAQTIKAEEIAAVTSIPDVYLEDSTINLWSWVRPRLSEAIAIALDNAVLFGVGAPGSYPTGGIVAATYSTPATAGVDSVDTVNNAMGVVEATGLAVTGHAADLMTKRMFRGTRDDTGALLLGTEQVGSRQQQTLYGVPIDYGSWNLASAGNFDFITGAWQNLLIGVRQDIRFALDPSAVIADDTGAVVVSGFQDNVTPLKVWARFGCAIVRPITQRSPGPQRPFAKAKLTTTAIGDPAANENETVTHKRGAASKSE